MQGSLNFTVPGLEKAITGTWIQVDERIADNATKEAFGLLQRKQNAVLSPP